MVDKNEQNGMSRREFISKTGVAAAGAVLAGSLPGYAGEGAKVCKKAKDKMIWAHLLQFSHNMWWDWDDGNWQDYDCIYKPYQRVDIKLWSDILKKMADVGMNMIVVDLGDCVQYESHPEVGVENAWTVKQWKTELARIRKMGIEPIPKLNFSTAHDAWLGKYHRMVSTDTYYAVCRDLIAEVIDIFDTPRFFHLGMDEESPQSTGQFSVVRQHGLWWHDLYFYVNQVERNGSRAWIWSDYLLKHPEDFYKKMPKSVLQSNWYYGNKFDTDPKAKADLALAKVYIELDKHGFDQIPTGSSVTKKENFQMTIDYCTKHISPERLLGFFQTPWAHTHEHNRAAHVESVELAGKAIAKYYAKS